MSSLTAAIRPTIRDVRKHPFSSLAAIILIAIPVALASFLLVSHASSNQFDQLTSLETVATKYGSSCEQNYRGWDFTCENGISSDSRGHGAQTTRQGVSDPELANQKISRDEIAAALGEDFHVELRATANAVFEAGDSSIQETVTQLDGAHLLPGNPHIPADGVVLTEETAHRLGAHIGDKVRIASLVWGNNKDNNAIESNVPTTLTVAAISPGWHNYVLAPTLVSDAQVSAAHEAKWSISGAPDFTWQDVKALNRLGLVVQSQDVSQHPNRIDPADMYEQYRASLESDQTDFVPDDPFAFTLTVALFMLSVYAIACLLILAAISPVFAVATSRQTAVYALMRSQGASRRHIRLAVMAYGTISGLIGGAIGVMLGVLAAVIRWKTAFVGWPMAFNVGWLILSFVLAVVGSTIAAAVPAILAARGSIMSGVEGSQPDRLRRWRKWMAIGPIGLVVIAIGKVAENTITYDWDFHSTFDEILFSLYSIASSLGIVGTVAFLIASVPALIFALGTVRKPLAAKLAGRLIRRQALKSSSIVAAIIGIVFVATTSIVVDSTYSLDNHAHASASFNEKAIVAKPSSRFQETAPSVPAEKLAADENNTPSPQIKEALDIVSKVIAPGDENLPTIPLYTMSENELPSPDLDLLYFSLDDGCSKKLDEFYQSTDPDAQLDSETARKCRYHRLSTRYTPSWLPSSDSVLIGGVELLQLINTDPTAMSEDKLAEATKVLEAGGVVGSSAIPLSGDQPFIVTTFPASDDAEPKVAVKATVPFSAALPEEFGGWIISPQAAEKLELSASYIGHAVIGDRAITYDDMTEISERINARHNFVEAWALNNPMPSPLIPLLIISAIILAILGLIVVLSIAQVRAQNEQLYALGAPTKLMRRVGAFYLGMMALAGTVPAVILGHIAAFFLLDPSEYDENGEIITVGSVEFWHIQWQLVAILCLVVPLIAALMGYFATRSNKYLSYRHD